MQTPPKDADLSKAHRVLNDVALRFDGIVHVL